MDKREVVEFLKKKVKEIPALRKLHHTDNKILVWRDSIERKLGNTFGRNSDEFRLFDGTRNRYFHSQKFTQQTYLRQLRKREKVLLTIIDNWDNPVVVTNEKIVQKSPIQLFDALLLHPKVIEVSEPLFKTGNYPQAILEAFKAVNNHVKDKTGLTLDGTNLMDSVFNENRPILKINELLTPSHKDEQKGFKYIFMGGQIGIRNLNAHEYVKLEDPGIALEYLCMASLLMKRVDESKLVKLNIKE